MPPDDGWRPARYYACESMYNVAKVARQDILLHFNTVFEGLCKLFADGACPRVSLSLSLRGSGRMGALRHASFTHSLTHPSN